MTLVKLYSLSVNSLPPISGIEFSVGHLLTPPIGFVVTVLAAGIVFKVTLEDRKKIRSERMFREMCDQCQQEENAK